jgi:SAM-dependent methyltransferase
VRLISIQPKKPNRQSHSAHAAFEPGSASYSSARRRHWDATAQALDRRQTGVYYHHRLIEAYRELVPPGLDVLEVGCGAGDLLEALQPRRGVGVDFSSEMVKLARIRHPAMSFVEQDAHDLEVEGQFDVILLSDLVNDLWDVQTVLERLRPLCRPRARLILNVYSRLWELPLALAEMLGQARPALRQNWLTVEDLENLLRLAGFETLRTFADVLWPVGTPGVARFANRFLTKLLPFSAFSLANFMVARPAPAAEKGAPRVSIVVPARNEAGNIDAIFARVPEMGRETELIFVEGHSKDDTAGAIARACSAHPERKSLFLRQAGTGKGDAVRLGFSAANGDILMILDADLTVPPEDLPRFYDAITSGQGEFINGVRLVYPMEDKAMRFLNLIGNKSFSLAFTWLLGQSVKDTLCGTKVLWKQDYERIAANRKRFGDFDPFGDFDLIFGAAKQNMKLVDLPVRYRERTYGTTNIQRYKHGLLLVRMVGFAAMRIKFV